MPQHLTITEIRNLTLCKWRYSFESAGFTRQEADRLIFLRFLYHRRPAAVR
jgi:hypothetical protein